MNPATCILETMMTLFAAHTAPPEYYTGFYSNYRLPYQVRAEDGIRAEQARQASAYVVIRRDTRGNIVDFKKILHGEVFIHHRYTYDGENRFSGYRDMRKNPPAPQ